MQSKHIPPKLVKKYDYKSCVRMNLKDGARVYLTPDGDQTPSVTTILSATKDQTHLIEWRKRVGEQRAQEITKEAANVGTAMHANLERFLLGKERKPGNNHVHVQADKMAEQIIINGLSKMDEIWSIEQSLWFPKIYSGTTDLIGVYQGTPSICDFKQSNKLKKQEWIDDYYMQLVAYAECHNAVYGTDIKQGVIFMCTRDLIYQQFDLKPEDYDKWKDQWWKRVEKYYQSLLELT
jgi:hypothetical protein